MGGICTGISTSICTGSVGIRTGICTSICTGMAFYQYRITTITTSRT